jgi:hypothetical protein
MTVTVTVRVREVGDRLYDMMMEELSLTMVWSNQPTDT